MNKSRKINKYKSISWLLIASFLLIILLPAHYHLHHLFGDSSVSHAHAFDLHLISDKAGQSHHDEDATIFTATPDGIVKKGNPEFHPFILLSVLLVLLPLIYFRTGPRLGYSIIGLKLSYPHLTPQLRAPPQF